MEVEERKERIWSSLMCRGSCILDQDHNYFGAPPGIHEFHFTIWGQEVYYRRRYSK